MRFSRVFERVTPRGVALFLCPNYHSNAILITNEPVKFYTRFRRLETLQSPGIHIGTLRDVGRFSGFSGECRSGLCGLADHQLCFEEDVLRFDLLLLDDLLDLKEGSFPNLVQRLIDGRQRRGNE